MTGRLIRLAAHPSNTPLAMETPIIRTNYESPLGTMILFSYKGRLCLCDWCNGQRTELNQRRVTRHLKAPVEDGMSDVLNVAICQLDEYFKRRRKSFNVPFMLIGTDFQRMVWSSLANIPYGHTLSYGEQSRRLGMPKSVRAVANADGSNPISIILPCHRVVGSDNSLTGYGGGLEVKQQLLDMEKGVRRIVW